MNGFIEVLLQSLPEIIGGIVVAILVAIVGVSRRKALRYFILRNQEYRTISDSKLQSTISHLLIEKGPKFSELIRKQILEDKARFRIVSDFFGEGDEPFENYKIGLYRFLDDPHARWVLTVYPEEGRCRFTSEEENEFLKILAKRDKHMVCFESGIRLVERSSFVTVIETDHETATRDLLLHLSNAQLTSQKKVHFVTLLGPKKHSIIDKRRHIQTEFLARVLSLHNIQTVPQNWFSGGEHDFWEGALNFLRTTQIIRVTALPCDTWSRVYASHLVKAFSGSLELLDNDSHTCFLCANDEVALGVKDAIGEQTKKTLQDLNVSIYGFDGIPEMVDILHHGVRGGTMQVQFNLMISQLEKLIRLQHFEIPKHIKIPAIIKATC